MTRARGCKIAGLLQDSLKTICAIQHSEHGQASELPYNWDNLVCRNPSSAKFSANSVPQNPPVLCLDLDNPPCFLGTQQDLPHGDPTTGAGPANRQRILRGHRYQPYARNGNRNTRDVFVFGAVPSHLPTTVVAVLAAALSRAAGQRAAPASSGSLNASMPIPRSPSPSASTAASPPDVSPSPALFFSFPPSSSNSNLVPPDSTSTPASSNPVALLQSIVANARARQQPENSIASEFAVPPPSPRRSTHSRSSAYQPSAPSPGEHTRQEAAVPSVLHPTVQPDSAPQLHPEPLAAHALLRSVPTPFGLPSQHSSLHHPYHRPGQSSSRTNARMAITRRALEALSVRELKRRLDLAQVSYARTVEKAELVELLLFHTSSSTSGSQPQSIDQWTSMSTRELKNRLDRAGVNYDGIVGKGALMALARSRLR